MPLRQQILLSYRQKVLKPTMKKANTEELHSRKNNTEIQNLQREKRETLTLINLGEKKEERDKCCESLL